MYDRMSSEELRLAKLWYDEDGKTPLEISQLLRRDKSTITRHVVKRTHQKRDGRPHDVARCERSCHGKGVAVGTAVSS